MRKVIPHFFEDNSWVPTTRIVEKERLFQISKNCIHTSSRHVQYMHIFVIIFQEIQNALGECAEKGKKEKKKEKRKKASQLYCIS